MKTNNTMGRLVSRMAEWEAKYKALAAKVSEKNVDAAERMVRMAIEIADETGSSRIETLGLMLTASLQMSKLVNDKRDDPHDHSQTE